MFFLLRAEFAGHFQLQFVNSGQAIADFADIADGAPLLVTMVDNDGRQKV